jgi:hypothetical protein
MTSRRRRSRRLRHARLSSNQSLATRSRAATRSAQALAKPYAEGLRPPSVATVTVGFEHGIQHRGGGCGGDEQGVARYLDVSIKSANETEYHLLESRDFSLISSEDWQRFTAETIEIRKMTYGYRKKVLDSD